MTDAALTRSVSTSSLTEDWLAVWIGLPIFALALLGVAGPDLLGWAVTTSVWTDPAKALGTASKAYAGIGGVGALAATYVALLVVLTASVAALKGDTKRFAIAFSAVFWIAYASWIIGSYAQLAAVTPADLQKYGIAWSLRLTNEGGFIVALVAGLIIANFLPRFADFLSEAIRPELYIKIAIVILGGFLAVTIAGKLSLASSLLLRGVAAIIEAYLIYWAVVYYVARKWFGFSREWAAPLASGISICGVSAAIATGSAIKARPIVPIMVSSLVVIFAVVELLFLPFVAQQFLYGQPLVAGAWMGLAVKTDGAAVASGAITDSLIRAKALAASGIAYQPGWIMGVSTTVKVFIDIFIGVWAFVLAWVWSAKIEHREGEKVRVSQIWQRFPKFILGYVITFLLVLALGAAVPALVPKIKASMGEANVFRAIFFVMTFFSIGLLSNFRKLWQEGIAKLAAVYVLCLFGYI